MTISLKTLAAASNGPIPGPNTRPNMLSLGNSLMWGQGLKPENRFRELVRLRLSQENGEVVELSMARSGAKVHPTNNPGVDLLDTTISHSLHNPPLDPIYSPSDFAREVPHSSLTTIQQLIDAEKILDAETYADPYDIDWILLDGGINDIGVEGILAPIAAYQDGYFLSGWSSWIFDKSKVIQNEMEDTLRTAVTLFPKAIIVVIGYFPIFSYYSVANITKLQSVGLLYSISNLVLLSPFGLDLLATASTTWQAASNKHLRRAIQTVTNENPNRTILFARSNIEGSRCLFAPQSWLWGYDAIPDDVPDSTSHWLQWFAGATPEDEVIGERISQCNKLTQGAGEAIPCRLASIGHPNLGGSQDYSRSIIEVLEDAGVINSDLDECSLARRRRKRSCTEFSDEWAYKCIKADAAIGKACAKTISAIGKEALNQFSEAGDHLAQAGSHLSDAAACFTTSGTMANIAKDQYKQAADHYNQAGEHLENIPECWDQTARDMQACDDTEASEIAECNSAYNQRVNGPCNIRCNRFKNCNRHSRWNPRRYICKAARAVCVAAAAVARAVCRAGALVIRGVCKAAAWTKSAICKAGVVLDNIVCSASLFGKALVDAAIGTGHVFLGTGAAFLEFSSDPLCALGNVGRAAIDTAISFGHGTAGTFLGSLAGAMFVGCAGLQWGVNRTCRFGNWTGKNLCYLGATIVDVLCWFVVPLKAIRRVELNEK